MPTGERASASWLASRWIKLLWHCASCRDLQCPLGSSCAVAKRTLFGAIASSCDAECKSLRQLVRHWMICPEVSCHVLEGQDRSQARVPAGIRSRNKAADTRMWNFASTHSSSSLLTGWLLPLVRGLAAELASSPLR